MAFKLSSVAELSDAIKGMPWKFLQFDAKLKWLTCMLGREVRNGIDLERREMRTY